MIRALNFILIGCGRIAQRHAGLIQHWGALIAVCDIVEERANAFGALYSCAAHNSIENILSSYKNIDVAVVCTPNGLHAQHSIAALNAGMHVLCEKPMAIKKEDCIAMINAAEKNNRKLFVVKQNRYNPPVAAVKKLLDENKLGKIFSVQLNCFWHRGDDYYKDSWHGKKDLDGGILFTQFSHFIDLLYWMFGDITDVSAITKNLAHTSAIEFEDSGVALLQFANGSIGSVHFTINSFKKNMEGSITIFAEKGTIKIGGQYLNELEYQCSDSFFIDNLPPGNSANNYGTYTGSMSNHDKVYENMLNVLQHNINAKTNAFEAMKTVEIIERIYASGR